MIPWLTFGINYIRKQQYIVLVYDIYPDLLVGLRALSPTHPVTRLWRFLNRIAYKHAKYVITLGPFMASSLGQYLDFRDKDHRLKIIPTWVDPIRFVPLDKESNPFAIKHGQQFKFTVMYSGNIGFSHDIQILIDAATRLRNQGTFHFLIIGDGPNKPLLIKRASSAKLDNITFLPFQDEEMLPLSLAAADVSVISIGKGVERLMMPSKTYYAMAVGSALLGLGDVIARYDCGVNVEPDDVDGVVAALKRFQFDRDYLHNCRKNARDAAVKHFSRTRITDKFCKLLNII
jgi:glycosyltransferase involved in cell wall biosynthesis